MGRDDSGALRPANPLASGRARRAQIGREQAESIYCSPLHLRALHDRKIREPRRLDFFRDRMR
jgi:hypothetical protein